MLGTELYADNAVHLWRSMGPGDSDELDAPPGVAIFRLPVRRTIKVVVRRAMWEAGDWWERLLAAPDREAVLLEDPFGALRPNGNGGAPDAFQNMPVMGARAEDVIDHGSSPLVRVEPVRDAEELTGAERIIIDGFPVRDPTPGRPGGHLPPKLIERPGLRVWSAHRDGRPAGACVSCDDGVAVGIYWLTTLPEYRSTGVGRALMNAVVGASPGREIVLTATDAGVPLYRSLGFTEFSVAAWSTWEPRQRRAAAPPHRRLGTD
ncbi:N-acetyltransferase [Nocardiopsis gilva YIM 90087]|uniref:N-acetyltransferase n=1 Tax=Nocardiopsis gilva YIM 90087 TaxID=1235441 RepID=A0A223SC87_9ACTN|nr:GNAT family N-acetyltransferase [Nocardiopsis gilva]ASU85705.1 N-acetyltransferase [Nocardiopsis gilva YIM 90087]